MRSLSPGQAGCAVIGMIVLNLALIAGGIWALVAFLRWLGVDI